MARRPHGIKSRKTIISVSQDDLAGALTRAKAADELLALPGGDRVTEREMQAIRDELAAAGTLPNTSDR
jgi:hypothetical protein